MLVDKTVAVCGYSAAFGLVSAATGSRYRSFEVHGTDGVATLCPIKAPHLVFNPARAVGPYPEGPHQVESPVCQRHAGDSAALAAAVQGEELLHVSFEEDIAVQEDLIAASGM